MRDLPIATKSDIYEAAMALVLFPISWLTPQSWWQALSRMVSASLAGVRRGTTRTRLRTLEPALSGLPGDHDPHAFRLNLFTGYMRERLAILREYRPGGWKADIRLVGRHHLDTALAEGKGAVLWIAPITYIDLVAKKGLAEAGYSVRHLSVRARGFDPNGCYVPEPSRMNRRLMSPLRTRIEDRYLAERIAIEPDGGLGYIRTLLKRLGDNEIVSIRAGNRGAKTIAAPMLGGKVTFAVGAPSLAQAAGAPLLPVFCEPTGTASFVLSIEPPITATVAGEAGATEAVIEYARRLEAFVTDHPELWSGWYAMEV